MLLAIDAGNSTIVAKLFCDEYFDAMTLCSESYVSYEKLYKFLHDASYNQHIDACIISSVVQNLSDKIIEAVRSLYNIEPMFVTDKLELGLKLKVKNPEYVGADRIANVCAAKHQYKMPAIVVDAGTAVNFDILDKNGDFIGGLIFPGIRLQTTALYDGTSFLPDAGVEEFSKYIEDETEYEIMTGVVGGIASAIDGLLIRCERELGEKPSVILTGGSAIYLEEYMDYTNYSLNPEHTLEGLAKIYELNATK